MDEMTSAELNQYLENIARLMPISAKESLGPEITFPNASLAENKPILEIFSMWFETAKQYVLARQSIPLLVVLIVFPITVA